MLCPNITVVWKEALRRRGVWFVFGGPMQLWCSNSTDSKGCEETSSELFVSVLHAGCFSRLLQNWRSAARCESEDGCLAGALDS